MRRGSTRARGWRLALASGGSRGGCSVRALTRAPTLIEQVRCQAAAGGALRGRLAAPTACRNRHFGGTTARCPAPPGADSPGAWLQNGTRVSGWAAQGPMGGGTAAVRYGGSRLLCALQHPGRELSPGRTRECVTPRRSSRRKIGRTAETTPRAHRVLCGHVRAPRPDSDVRSSLAYRRESYRAALVLQAWIGSRVRSIYIYIFNKLSTYDTFQKRSMKLKGYV